MYKVKSKHLVLYFNNKALKFKVHHKSEIYFVFCRIGIICPAMFKQFY